VRLLYLPCHSILEHDEVRLFHSLGHEVASIGAYINPSAPLDNLRPPLPNVPMVELVKREVDALGQQGHIDTLDAAKRHIPDAIIDWAEVIIVAGFEHSYLIPQWERLRHKRVIWRTIGQSGDANERAMAPLRRDGCEIVRYSPKERNIPSFAGEDALIRFAKDPNDWHGWTGEDAVVTNISQSLYQRSLADDGGLQPSGQQWTSFSFWRGATRDLPTRPAGPGSNVIGGLGKLDYSQMQELLRRSRAYLYTGTQPASYTLGFIEAMMTGTPVVSIGPEWYRILPYGPGMFEGHELAVLSARDPEDAHAHLERLLREPEYADEISVQTRERARQLFGMQKIAGQWQRFLGGSPYVPADADMVLAAA
jgi:glycosyltransferase involved in cell wall biosynthesis